MTINDALKQNNMSIYRLAKSSSVPYATLNDICNGKTRLEKCSAETIYRIAGALNVSMESLLAPCFIKRSSFQNFRSSICHRLKELGDVDFIIETLENQDIRLFFERKWYPESLYLLAMLDYISRENNIPLDSEYDDIRKCKLQEPVYPTSIQALYAASGNRNVLDEAASHSIPEFARFNIIEGEVRDAV